MRPLLWLLLSTPLFAQVSVALSPMPKLASQRLLGSRVSRIAMPWLVSMQNDSDTPISVLPSAVYRRIPQLQPFDHESMALLIAEGAQNSGWARGARAASDVGRMAAFLAAARTIRIKETWPLTAATGAEVLIPYLIARFQGAAVPAGANFERLAWVEPLQLGPGESGGTHVFTAAWTGAQPLSFVIETARARTAKEIR